jgi:hypothetical protein
VISPLEIEPPQRRVAGIDADRPLSVCGDRLWLEPTTNAPSPLTAIAVLWLSPTTTPVLLIAGAPRAAHFQLRPNPLAKQPPEIATSPSFG